TFAANNKSSTHIRILFKKSSRHSKAEDRLREYSKSLPIQQKCEDFQQSLSKTTMQKKIAPAESQTAL
ncbi:hypothetical protein, partial [uncultured Parasutterella sp.]|uniref:hypothetical protein n=1 Tax=uncultured Parasutterella sp. TaxID=1263098 RepID=UPI0025997122